MRLTSNQRLMFLVKTSGVTQYVSTLNVLKFLQVEDVSMQMDSVLGVKDLELVSVLLTVVHHVLKVVSMRMQLTTTLELLSKLLTNTVTSYVHSHLVKTLRT